MRPKIVILAIALSLINARAFSELDYIKAASGVSYTHAHVERTGGIMSEDPNSETGYSWTATKLTNVEETNRIPLIKGHGFHVQLLLFTLPVETTAIDVSWTHPAMALPSGDVIQYGAASIPTETGLAFPGASFTYTLDEDYELVEGDWVVTFSHQRKELFQITFTTYKVNET
jgi:hypothetical protein